MLEMTPSLSNKERLLYQHLCQVKSTTSSVDRRRLALGEGGSVDLVGTKFGAEVESGVSLTLGAGVSLALGAARSKKVPMAKQTMRLIIVLVGGCDCCEAQLCNYSFMAVADVCAQSVVTSPRILIVEIRWQKKSNRTMLHFLAPYTHASIHMHRKAVDLYVYRETDPGSVGIHTETETHLSWWMIQFNIYSSILIISHLEFYNNETSSLAS